MTETIGSSVELPNYDHPPVTEFVMGVEFVPMPNLDVVELFRVREAMKEWLPKVEAQAPLPPGAPLGHAAIGFGMRLMPARPEVRLWVISEDDHVLVQIQNDRLMLNWRQIDTVTAYPSYATLRPQFERAWKAFATEVTTVGDLQPLTAQVAFINSVDAGQDNRLGAVLNHIDQPELPGLLVGSKLQYVSTLVDDSGRQAQLSVASETPLADQRVGLSIETRTSLLGQAGVAFDDIMGVLRFSHDTCVEAFTQLTTPEMHEKWERKK